MSRKKRKQQDDALFETHEGAYGHVIEYPAGGEATKAAIDPATTHQIGEIAVSEANQTSLEAKQARFKEKFADAFWIPSSQYEMTLALQTLPIAIDHIAAGMGSNNQRVVRQIYQSTQGYYGRASLGFTELEDAYILEGDSDPSIARIRREYPIKIVLAEFLLARESFENLKWLPRKISPKSRIDSREKRLQLLIKDLENKPSTELLKDWEDARSSFQNQAEFWHDQMLQVQHSQRVQEIHSENLSRRV